LKRLGILLVVLSLSLVVASPVFAQENRADRIIDRTFDRVFGSPSQSQYDRPTPPDANGNLPPRVERALCQSIVRNNAIPRSIQRRIARQFGLDCRPAGSFLDLFFRRFPF